MSKLGDRIRKTTRVEPAPIGFRAVRPEKNPALLVTALLDDKAKVAEAIEKGAGAIVLKDAKAGDLKAALEASGEVPCGVWPKEIDAKAVADFVEEHADFLVFDAESTPANALLEEKPGYVLVLKEGQDDTYLRVLESVALDAILPEGWSGPLTLRRQVELRRIAGLTRKPLMLPIDLPVESGDLECLRDAGISVLLVDGRALAEMPSLVQAIQALPGPRRRRETTLEVLLPRAAEMADEDEEEDDEDDG